MVPSCFTAVGSTLYFRAFLTKLFWSDQRNRIVEERWNLRRHGDGQGYCGRRIQWKSVAVLPPTSPPGSTLFFHSHRRNQRNRIVEERWNHSRNYLLMTSRLKDGVQPPVLPHPPSRKLSSPKSLEIFPSALQIFYRMVLVPGFEPGRRNESPS